ncbi:Methyltransferase domain-containing protein [Variovorax sp. OV700]|nr:Methyltransferase domain-containing protein [Variovorax sp. OV700]
MTHYWKNYYEANADKFADSLMKQVDRTINGAEEEQSEIDLTVESLRQVLNLDSTDQVADLCCGNGLLTRAVACGVATMIGVDFSEKLIACANRFNAASNVRYVVGDVSKLDGSFFSSVTKVFMESSVQHLESDELSRLLRTLGSTPNIEAVFIGGVPDADRLSVYYDDDRKMAFYRQREAEGRPHIGTWWSQPQLQKVVEDSGLRVRFLPQDARLTSAYYRYDCLIERPSR